MVSNEELLNTYSEKNLQIIDARTPDEFAGKNIRAIRGGHIPNAINIPFEENWQDPSAGIKLSKKQVSTNAGMTLKTKEELQKLYAKLDPE
jgi:thiosulfate/3-mercaptopyruvate sulfurtransferase